MNGFDIERAVPGDGALLFRLLQLYYFDATRWSGEDILDTGLYDCAEAGVRAYLEPSGEDRAYLLKVDGKVAGFVLVEQIDFEGGRIAEFADLFVLPKYRGRGLASEAVRQIVLASGHSWLIAVFRGDEEALRYWRNAFTRLPFRSVREAPASEAFHLFVVNEGVNEGADI